MDFLRFVPKITGCRMGTGQMGAKAGLFHPTFLPTSENFFFFPPFILYALSFSPRPRNRPFFEPYLSLLEANLSLSKAILSLPEANLSLRKPNQSHRKPNCSLQEANCSYLGKRWQVQSVRCQVPLHCRVGNQGTEKGKRHEAKKTPHEGGVRGCSEERSPADESPY